MKKKLCLLFAFMFIFVGISQCPVIASNIMPRDNNAYSTNTKFTISETGAALVYVDYQGYPSITTNATISIKIEKRNLLIFWNEVINNVYYFQEESFANTFIYQLEKSGTYRCTVEYTISGTGGADDVITFQEKATY